MKKILKSSILAVAGLVLAINANAKTIENGVLKIATEGTYSPYSYHDKSDKLTGFDVDIAEFETRICRSPMGCYACSF